MNKVCFNGQLFDEKAPLFDAANRGFRYGDGLFETMKLLGGDVLHFSYHIERLHKGLHALQLSSNDLTKERLLSEINTLSQVNGCSDRARIRLAVYRDDMGKASYVLEAHALSEAAMQWQHEGWSLALYTQNQKSCDELANIKTANYLLYVLAGLHAQQQGADESLVLNTAGNLCDGSRTNLFLLQNKIVKTPALDQGCVAGVMRRFILDQCKALGIPVQECTLTISDLLQADEIFLTNAIQGIRWVKSFESKIYGNRFSRQLYQQTLATIYS